MANINLINPPKYSTGEIEDAFLREIKTGFELEKARAEARHKTAAQEAAEYRKANRTVKGLGKVVACIDTRDFLRAQAKYGSEEVHSKEFLRSLRRFHPELCVNRV